VQLLLAPKYYTGIQHIKYKTVQVKNGVLLFWREKKLYRTDRDLSIVRQRRLMKAFAAIKFKQKWMMPLCFLNHLASD
jgi:hypothetical protein